MTRWTMNREQVLFDHLCPLHMGEEDYRELMNSLALFFDTTKARNDDKQDTLFYQRLFRLPYSELPLQHLKHGIRKVSFGITWLPISGPSLMVEFTTALVYRRLVSYQLY